METPDVLARFRIESGDGEPSPSPFRMTLYRRYVFLTARIPHYKRPPTLCGTTSLTYD